jgi:hypothetical protein
MSKEALAARVATVTKKRITSSIKQSSTKRRLKSDF